jgi:probable FeS assembly SUF system protein SufT
VLARECEATTVPYGERVVLSAGGEVEIVQQLGASITVRTELGSLLRIDGADADALGIEVVPGADADTGAAPAEFDLDRVMDAVAGAYDPETAVGIVALGVAYRCGGSERPAGTRRIEIDMSMTAPGCGMGDVLRVDAERAVLAVPGVDDVHVELVWDPPWTIDRISEAARLQLGLL